MEDIKNNQNSSNHEDGNTSKDVKKRISYPAKELKVMIEFIGVIYSNLGHGDYHSNKDIAKQHKLAADSIKYHLSSAQHYNLLELKFGVGYKVTDLFRKIHHPYDDNERRSAIIESLKSPRIFSQLFEEYEGQILPSPYGIKNHFVRNFHLREDSAERAAEVFLNNVKEYNLIDIRGVLTTKEVNNNKDNLIPVIIEKVDEDRQPPQEKKVDINTFNEGVKLIDIIIPLKSSKGKAHLLIPEDYKEEDLDRIAKFVEALK